MTFLLAVVLLLSLPTPAAGQFVCGGHFVNGVAVRTAAADVDRSALLSQPSWFTARDRELWDQLIYNAFDNFKTNAGPLERRQTLVIAADRVPTITVCMDSADQSYTGERLAAFANEAWWRDSFEHWTRQRWNGKLQIGRECDGRLFSKIEVREGDPEDLGDNTLARADSSRGGSRWLRTEILFHPEHLADIDEGQASWALMHELGHGLGMWHVEPGTGFVMEAMNPRATRMMPAKERELAQLAYDVGPGEVYPGLEGATPVPALPFLDGLFRWLMR